jgi:hypothetical protein
VHQRFLKRLFGLKAILYVMHEAAIPDDYSSDHSFDEQTGSVFDLDHSLPRDGCMVSSVQ